MTGLTQIHQCPRCVLRFTSISELEYHLSNDHTPRPRVEDGPASVASTAVPPATAVTPATPSSESSRVATRARGARSAAWILGVAGAVALVIAGIATWTSTTLIVLGVVVAVASSYVWHERGRRRHSHE